MSMKERRKIAGTIGICWILSVLGWCTQDKSTNETISTIETIEPAVNNETQNTTNMEETNIQKQLVINPWCIGCWRCAMFAPNNFAMNGKQAEVISQENINSPQVQQASSRCPVQVIEIIEA